MALESEPVVVTAPTLTVVWIHDPTDPEATVRAFRWNGGGRSEDHQVTGQAIVLAGRTYPVYEFAQRAQRAVNIPLLLLDVDSRLPDVGGWGDDHAGDVDYLTALLESRKAWVYRDDRGRLLYGVAFGLPWSDQPFGSSVELTLNATDFDEAAFYNPFTILVAE